jgi:biopolymer transport protein ExbB/TolQ
MSILTLELIALLFAAWKAPAWVREIGLIALVTGLFSTMLGFAQAAAAIQAAGDISPSFVWGGVRVALITIMYGTLIYLVSLVIRIVQKPRLL